ncbi:MAG: hypothetical protein HYY45_03175 [Deltaproteobacteria bacterium]|nr:hypothetical protein [Deltaproteobacteria bacterium]
MAKTKKTQKKAGPEKKNFSISGRVIDIKAHGIAGLRVEAWDKDLIFDDLVGSAVTDAQGAFQIEFTGSYFQELFLDRKPDLFFKVFRDGELIKSTEDSVLWNVKAGEQTITIEVGRASDAPGRTDAVRTAPKPPPVSLADVLQAAHAQPRLREALQRSDLTEIKDLFSPKGMKALKEAGLPAGEQRKLLATAKFAAASGSIELGKRLADSGLTSLSRLGRLPKQRLEKMLSGVNDTERQALGQLYYTAQVVNSQTREASIRYQRLLSRDATWYPDVSEDLPPEDALDIEEADSCGDGDACFNVFSPIAYIFDLLGFIYDNWNIPSDTLEGLFYQEIDALDCDQGFQPVPQIHLAIDVLEKHLGSARSLQASARCADIYKRGIETVLSLSGIDRKNLSGIETDLSSGSPTLAVFQRTIDGIRDGYRNVLEVVYPPAESPSAGDQEAEREYLIEQDRIKRQRDSAMAELENLLRTVFSSFLAIYREELIKESSNRAGQLENLLFIDLRSAPSQMTNRITQVIQSLQSFVLAVRTREIKEHPTTDVASLFAEEYEFDEATWTWLGEYATWAAAMYTLVYPENVIALPSFRQSMTDGFRNAISSVSQPMGRESVESALNEYDKHLEIIGNLKPVGAHVIGQTIYLTAGGGGNLWINQSPLPIQHWAGWRPLGKDDLVPWGTALYSTGEETRIVAACYKKGTPRKCEFRWISDDGDLDDESFAEVDLDHPSLDPAPEYGMLPSGQLENRLFYNVAGAPPGVGELRPVLRVDVKQGSDWHHKIIVVWKDQVEWRDDWEPFSNLGSMRVFLVKDQHFQLRGNSVGRVDIHNITGELWVSEFTLSPLQVGELDDIQEPGYGYDPHFYDNDFILATSQQSTAFYLVCRTRSGSIMVGAVAVPDETPDLDQTFHTVSAGQARMERGLRSALSAPAGENIPRFLRQIYFEERYLYFPLFAGWALNRAGDYVSAHDWYRKLYDPFGQKAKYGFPFDTYFTGEFSRPEHWLADPLDPYATAAQRGGVYLRHTILMMVKNLLDWADHEFARSGPESLNRARELYLLAERILKAPELYNLCHKGLDSLRIEIQKNFGLDVAVVIPDFNDLYGIDFRKLIEETERIIREITDSGESVMRVSRRAKAAVTNAVAAARRMRTDERLETAYRKGRERIETIENAVIEKSLPQFLGASRGNRVLLYSPISGAPETRSIAFSIPPNPLLKAFSFHILSNLAKLYADLNIAGDWTPQLAGGNGLGNLYGFPSGLWSPTDFIEPPRYRYSYLAEKARQQAGFAQQLGAALLQAIEKEDAAAFERLQAEHAIAVAEATVTLKDLAKIEANNAKLVAGQQKSRATVQRVFWDKRLDTGYSGGFLGFGVGGISEAEFAGMGLMAVSGGLQGLAALVYGGMVLPAMAVAGIGGTITAAGGAASAIGAAASMTGVGTLPGWALFAGGMATMAGGMVTAGPGALLVGGQHLASALQAAGGAAGTFGSLALTIASFQRRWEDWKLQYDLANIDQTIADLQVTLAQDRIHIADQDKQIADLQRTHAVQVLNFLKTKFSNLELYEWMRDVLIQQYRIVMEIATSTALLAQRSLEFERQEPINIITDDYWSVDTSTLSAQNLTDEQKSAGLLGAERLLTALTQLDDNKLQKDRRRLQISKTVSLARLMPTELIELRETGKITFNTLMDWFDWDFPGHYLRLIKSVKVSVLALVPPIDGIHAMLTNGGESSVVVNENGGFVKKRAMRTYGEIIALDAAYNESGLFVLDYNDPMFLPFEGLGVETEWTFELSRATNRFNFDTIIDVLFTIEYTALHSEEYARQVKERLGDHSSASTYLDLRQTFPDQWYHLKNPKRKPDGTIDVQPINLNVPDSLFPPNLTDVRLAHVTVIVVGDLKGVDNGATYALRHDLLSGIGLSKGGPINGLVPIQCKDTYAVLSTRTNGAVREFWHNIPGGAISDIPSDLDTRPPDDFEFLSSLEGGTNLGEYYVSRVRGYLKAPTTGAYTFWLASDDQGEFHLSTVPEPAAPVLQKRAYVSTWTSSREWNKPGESGQESTPVALEADKKYYFEVLHKEGFGGDNVAVGWLKPGDPGPGPSEVIPGSCLSLYSESLPSDDPSGEWSIHLSSQLYSPAAGTDQKSLVDRIDNIILVLTVEGKVKW